MTCLRMGLRYLCYLPFSSRAPETQLGFRDENLPECRLQLQDENIKAKKFGSRGLIHSPREPCVI